MSSIRSNSGLARLAIVFALLAALPAATQAADDDEADDGIPGSFEAEVGLVSDYIDRGISNSDHNPALQGGISYSIDTGLGDTAAYAGFWGSSVDFDDGGEATVELDWYFGLNGTVPGTELASDIGGSPTTPGRASRTTRTGRSASPSPTPASASASTTPTPT